jgi:hypothetical protein
MKYLGDCLEILKKYPLKNRCSKDIRRTVLADLPEDQVGGTSQRSILKRD